MNGGVHLASASESPKPQFEMVETSPRIGAANRNTEGGTLYPTGRLPVNAEASDIWRQLVQECGLPADNHLCKFAVHKPSRTVAAYPVPHGTPNCAPVRINPHKTAADTLTFYLGGVFEEHPELRPTGKRTVTVVADTDQNGRPIMVISLASSLQARTMPQVSP
jgi:hypothetical protein